MERGFFLYRWFKNVSISRKLYFTVGTMAVLIGVELFVLFFSLSTLSSLRAYVGGEGLWSKAQKDAVFHLYRYGVSRTEKDYQLFEQFMQVPMGDAKARRELMQSDPSMSVAHEGFIEGRNHPDDIDGMISLFVDFSNVSYIKKAIAIWGDAQAIATQLLPISQALHEQIVSPHPSQAKIDELLATIYNINEKLTSYEDDFSFTLGEGSRWLERIVLKLLFATALTVEATGLFLAASVSRGIHKGLTNIIDAASSFSAGDLSSRARVLSGDEIGVVANSFNEMASNLQAQVKELAQLNENLRLEISKRERAETAVRQAYARLETAHQELQYQTADRLRAEELLRQSEKMRALGQLTGGIAHDFNNLLGVIIGSVEVLIDTVKDMPDQTDLANEILKSALNGSRLTRRLLAVGRNQPLRPQRVNLSLLLSGEIEMLRRTLGESIHVVAVSAPDLWFTSADPSQIGDALLNLALNARDAMPHGGTLRIEAANLHLDAQSAAEYSELADGDYVVLTVTDTGTGMPQSVVQRAIEPFFTTKPPSIGSGLGLSMAYGFAKQSGGHLDIKSAVGMGTKVSIYLPRANEPTERSIDPVTASATGAGEPNGAETILLVDDNQSLMAVTRRTLSALGYKVVPATDARSALAILASDAVVDLLFTDVVMPGGMNGPELAEAARRLRPGLRVLFTTGYTETSVEGADRQVLRKPYGRRGLATAIRTVLDGLTTRT
jgi:signal transduction histidine kinase/CheY-like chemotaxis protein